MNNEVLAVYGDENDGQYVEIVDMKTGKTVGHKVFPGRQPVPKKEAKEEERAQKDRLSENGPGGSLETAGDGQQSGWTMSCFWPMARKGLRLASGNALDVFRRFELRGVPRSLPQLQTGCEVVAYDLKGRKMLWRTHLKGSVGSVVDKMNIGITVRLERVNDEVLAVYGDEILLAATSKSWT